MDVLLITGPASVGKSTVAWEVGRLLAERQIRHAVIDSDELDRVFPQPTPLPELLALSERNLAAVWASFAALGHDRLVLAGVMLYLDIDLPWINAALPDANITVVRLLASDATLRQRLVVREIGSGHDAQLARTLRWAAAFRAERDTLIRIGTDGKGVTEIAREVLSASGW